MYNKTKFLLFTILIFLLFCIHLPCYSQYELYDVVKKDLKKIEKTTKNPVIVIGPEKSFSLSSIKLKSGEDVIVWEWYCLIYKQGNKNYFVKYVNTLIDYNKKNIFKSNSIEFVNDTLFDWINSKKEIIRDEEILPFIYLDTMDSVPVYKQGFMMHTFPYDLSIHFPTDSLIPNSKSFIFDEIAMQTTLMPSLFDLPKNLNFEHNSKLKIYHLYSLLKSMLEKYDDKFIFK
jgi:hypothetical protein